MHKAKSPSYKFEGGIYSWGKRPLSYPKYSWPSTFLAFGISQNATWHIPRASKNAYIINLQILENRTWLFNCVHFFSILSFSDFCLYLYLSSSDKGFSFYTLIMFLCALPLWIFTLVDVYASTQVFDKWTIEMDHRWCWHVFLITKNTCDFHIFILTFSNSRSSSLYDMLYLH